ncbi:hypothetical protein GCM10009827_074040 [Dactylosporangium maewongense]|uniref:Uncharacterized protein n=1 Tax=Dactylosporangium maewongense TaxID=634393 RepID=A0ABN2BLQ9_9ACTN
MDERGDETGFGEAGTDEELPAAPGRSRWIWLVTAVVAALVVVGAVVYVRLGGTTHSLPEAVAPKTSATPSALVLEPRPTGAACRDARPGQCGDDEQGLAAFPLTVQDWDFRIEHRFRPAYGPQVREGLLEGTTSTEIALPGDVFGADGQPLPSAEPKTTSADGRVTIVYDKDRHLRTIECRVDIMASTRQAPDGLQLLQACVRAIVTDDIAAETNTWMAQHIRPTDSPTAVVSRWACGWLALELTVGFRDSVVTMSAPAGQHATPCAQVDRK